MEGERRSTARKREFEDLEEGAYGITHEHGNYKKFKLTEVDIPNLPTELWTKILSVFDLVTLLKLKSTSIMFRDIIYRVLNIQNQDIILEANSPRHIQYSDYWVFPSKESRILIVDRPYPLNHVQTAYLLRPPYRLTDLDASVSLPSKPVSPNDPGVRYSVAYLNDETWLVVGEAAESWILSIRSERQTDIALVLEPLDRYYPQSLRLHSLPTALDIQKIPPNLQDLSVQQLLQSLWEEHPLTLPGVGSLLRIRNALLLVTLPKVYYAGDGQIPSQRFGMWNMRPRFQSAGSGMLLLDTLMTRRQVIRGDRKRWLREGMFLRYDPRTGMLIPTFSIIYPQDVNMINATILLNRYVLITPDMFLPNYRDKNFGRIYLYDLESTSREFIHSFSVPKAPKTPISYLYASGSTVVAFYRVAESNDHRITHVALHSLVTGIICLDHILEWKIGDIMAASRDFVFTTYHGDVVWFDVLRASRIFEIETTPGSEMIETQDPRTESSPMLTD